MNLASFTQHNTYELHVCGCLGLGVGTEVDYNDVAQGIVLDVITVKIIV